MAKSNFDDGESLPGIINNFIKDKQKREELLYYKVNGEHICVDSVDYVLAAEGGY